MLGAVRRVPRMGSQRPDIGLLIRRNNISSRVCAVAAGRSDIHCRKRFSTQSSFVEILPATRSSPPWWCTASLTISALAAGSTLLNRDSRAQCEAETQSDPVTPPLNAADDDEEEDDPYASLPDEDEETDCDMCNTFRQGPCRPYWRKLERCFKDNDKQENVVAKCLRYFQPHQECVMEYDSEYPFGGGATGGGSSPFEGDVFAEAQQIMMSNPNVQAIMARAQADPKIMQKVFAKYQNDPGMAELIQELRKYM